MAVGACERLTRVTAHSYTTAELVLCSRDRMILMYLPFSPGFTLHTCSHAVSVLSERHQHNRRSSGTYLVSLDVEMGTELAGNRLIETIVRDATFHQV